MTYVYVIQGLTPDKTIDMGLLKMSLQYFLLTDIIYNSSKIELQGVIFDEHLPIAV